MIRELIDRSDPEFWEFWNNTHPFSIEEYGYREGASSWHFFAEWIEMGRIRSAIILQPIHGKNGLIGHVVHLCSEHRSKALIRFCRSTMELMKANPQIGVVSFEPQNFTNLENVKRLARFLGFRPILVHGHGWYDYLWNSKRRNLQAA